MIPGSANPLLLKSAAAGGLQIERSLRFNSSDSAYLSRVVGTASNRKTWTWSGWVKRGSIGSSYEILFSARAGTSGNRDYLTFQNDQLVLTCSDSSGTTTANIQTTSVYRDPGAWMHIVLSADTTQATASNRVKFYVNGTQVTVFSLANYPTQNTDLSYNDAQPHTIGQSAAGAALGFNGYLANIHFIDGQALDPSSFTETDATTGQLIPKTYTGSYGTNGYNLLFADNSSNTASTLGKDTSGLSNNWTPNNLSVTAGAGNDSLVDSPTNYGTDTGVGGTVRGNYCTFNPLDLPASGVFSNGNMEFSHTGGGGVWRTGLGTIALSSGKWYWEMVPTVIADAMIGIVKSDWSPTANSSQFWATASGYGYLNNGSKYNNGSGAAYGASFTTNDVIGIALDLDAGTLVFYKNGASQGTAYSSLSGTFKPAFGAYQTCLGIANWGQRAFAYTSPAGFKALNTANLPTPLVTKSNTAMDVALWTGNGSSPRSITGLEFNPDFVWIKERSAGSYYHRLFDAVRGTSNSLYLPGTDAENTYSSGYANVSSFDSSGFTLTNTNGGNNSGVTYVGWAWDAGTSTVSNTQGSITSQVRANATAGFSVVNYTSIGAGTPIDTIGHGLGVSPVMVIVKNRDITDNWLVTRSDFSNPLRNYLFLNTTAAIASVSVDAFSFSSTTVGLRQSAVASASGQNIILYVFAPVVGYSSFGSYTGGGSAGRFVYTGFRPKLIWVKNYNDGSYPTLTGWFMWDSVRGAYNYNQSNLIANSSNIEGIRNNGGSILSIGVDILSNGFCLRGADDADTNWGSGQYIYCAWAEMPFNYSRAR